MTGPVTAAEPRPVTAAEPRHVTAAEPRHVVVRNDEEQYSSWPAGRPAPAGWQEVGFAGSEAECVGYVDSVWTDMRPRSLREATAAGGDGDD